MQEYTRQIGRRLFTAWKHFRIHYTSEGKVRKLGGAHVNIHADVYFHEKKAGEVRVCVKYWYKNPSDEFVSSVGSSLINAQELDLNNIAWINNCAGGDHANVKFRLLEKTIVVTPDSKYYVNIYSLEYVHCIISRKIIGRDSTTQSWNQW